MTGTNSNLTHPAASNIYYLSSCMHLCSDTNLLLSLAGTDDDDVVVVCI
jgi:hypothetical protein